MFLSLLPVALKKTSFYIENPSFWKENLHVLVNLWSPCFGRMDACLNFIIQNGSCYTPPSRSIQHISKHRNSFINQKQLETKVPAYTSPQQRTRCSFPCSLIFLTCLNVQRWNFPPQLISQVALACRDRNKKTLAKHQTTQRTSIPSPNEIEGSYKKWERPKGCFFLGGVEFW